MPGKYVELLRVGCYVVPIEITFLPTTCHEDGEDFVTSKWADRKHWKEIKVLLKPAAESCVSSTKETCSTGPHIVYGTEVGLGYSLCVDSVNETTHVTRILDTRRNCWTDDEDDCDSMSALNTHGDYDIATGGSRILTLSTRAYIKAAVVKRTLSMSDDSRRLKKELTYKREDILAYVQPTKSKKALTSKKSAHRREFRNTLSRGTITETSYISPSRTFGVERLRDAVTSKTGQTYYEEQDEESNDGYMEKELHTDDKLVCSDDDDNLSLPDIDAPAPQSDLREFSKACTTVKTKENTLVTNDASQSKHVKHKRVKGTSHYNEPIPTQDIEKPGLQLLNHSKHQKQKTDTRVRSLSQQVQLKKRMSKLSKKGHENKPKTVTAHSQENSRTGKFNSTCSDNLDESLDSIETRMLFAASEVLKRTGYNTTSLKLKTSAKQTSGMKRRHTTFTTVSTEDSTAPLGNEKSQTESSAPQIRNPRYEEDNRASHLSLGKEMTPPKTTSSSFQPTKKTNSLTSKDIDTLLYSSSTAVTKVLPKIKKSGSKRSKKRKFPTNTEPIPLIIADDWIDAARTELADIVIDPEMPVLIPETMTPIDRDPPSYNRPILTPCVTVEKRNVRESTTRLSRKSRGDMSTVDSTHSVSNSQFPVMEESGYRRSLSFEHTNNFVIPPVSGVYNLPVHTPTPTMDEAEENAGNQQISEDRSVGQLVSHTSNAITNTTSNESSQMMPPPAHPAPRTPKKALTQHHYPFIPPAKKPNLSANQIQPSKLSTLQIMCNPNMLSAGVGLLKTLSSKNVDTSTTHEKTLNSEVRTNRVRALSPDITELPSQPQNEGSGQSVNKRDLVSGRFHSAPDLLEEDSSDNEYEPYPYAGQDLIRELLNRVHENAKVHDSYEPEGDGYDLSQKSMCYLNIIPEYSRKSRSFKIHCKKITDLTFEKLEDHYLSIRPALRQIFEGEVPNARSTTYLQGPAGIKRLQEMSVSIPFDHDQTSSIITMLLQYFIPDTSDRPKWSDYISYVLLPEALINIYAKVNEISYEMAEKEMRYQACYDDAGLESQ